MIKFYDGLSEATNYEVNLNRICRSFDFKSYICSKHGICSNGLTISCWFSVERNSLIFSPQIKYYGYDHVCNNGSEHTDMGDYTIGPAVSKEVGITMLEYFRVHEPELYAVMADKIVL